VLGTADEDCWPCGCFAARAQAGMFFHVPLPPPTAVRSPHRTENEACCVWKNAAVKELSVRLLLFKTKRSISRKNTAVVPITRAR